MHFAFTLKSSGNRGIEKNKVNVKIFLFTKTLFLGKKTLWLEHFLSFRHLISSTRVGESDLYPPKKVLPYTTNQQIGVKSCT